MTALAVPPAPGATQPRPVPPLLSPAEAAAAWIAGAVPVDLRTTAERRRDGLLPGAVDDPEAAGGRPLLLVCADGRRAAALAARLPTGTASVVVGGFAGWRAAVWRRWGEVLLIEPDVPVTRFFRALG
ncbi:rhodanese-related sulfurtransferase [Friedmanniella endophytica]|uniref:Rhodanese-related sulfurtransferase n=1 Tax=Microlunatus kandeliicorticis TaxID=1759536 RepID=A0A7W3IR68_9ACTN|nr:rhodanese-like domain-containing protein [Microlunatus kandeliicorticis]MBA8793759.1 rhodanese-related sulfurtransferase [Microlunatus kandeliicorticis]